MRWDEKKAKCNKRYKKKIFSEILYVLNHARVYKVKDLRSFDNPKEKLSGTCEPCGLREYHRIYINQDTPENEVSSLMHECLHICLHILFSDQSEATTERAERVLVKAFSSSQKAVLMEYIPSKVSVFGRDKRGIYKML